jgi:hypothetical protein
LGAGVQVLHAKLPVAPGTGLSTRRMLIFGIKAYVGSLGYMSSTSLKISHPHGLPL